MENVQKNNLVFSPVFISKNAVITPGAANNACEHHMRWMHVVCMWKKGYKAAFSRLRVALSHALCLWCREQSMRQSPPLLANDTFVGFIPTAGHMCSSHVGSTCDAFCPRRRLPTVLMRAGRAGTRETAQGGIMYGYMFCLVVYCVLMFEGIVRDLET